MCRWQVFVPPKKAEHPPDFTINDYALGRFAYIFVTLTMGWPAYLFFNVTSRPYKSRWVNHFDPYSEIFSKRERVEVCCRGFFLMWLGGPARLTP